MEALNPNSSNSPRQAPKSNGKKMVDGSDGLEMDPELSFRITFRKIVSFFSNYLFDVLVVAVLFSCLDTFSNCVLVSSVCVSLISLLFGKIAGFFNWRLYDI